MTRARDIANLGEDKATLAAYVDTGVTDTDLERIDVTTEGTTEASKVVTADASGHVTYAGEIRGPATFVVDPATVGDATGLLHVKGGLQVDGTTTTLNSTTLTVDDKNIELGSVDTPSDTTADGGGITLKGATDKTISWTNSTDSWDFNQGINVTSGNVGIGTTAPAVALEVIDKSNLETVAGFGADDDGTAFISVRTAETQNNLAGLTFSVGTATPTGVGSSASIGHVLGKVVNSGGPLHGELQFHTNYSDSITQKMVITDTGNVGIGTTSPSAGNLLHVYNNTATTASAIKIENATANYNAALQLKTTVADWDIGSNINAPAGSFELYERTSGSAGSRFTIAPGGKVGIGTTSPGVAYRILGASAAALTLYSDTNWGARYEVGGAHSTDDNVLGAYTFINTDNTDASGATGRIVGGMAAAYQGSSSNASDDSGADLVFYTKPEGGNMASVMTLNGAGNVGIGTTAPANDLEIGAYSGDKTLCLTSGENGNTYLRMNDGEESQGYYIQSVGSASIAGMLFHIGNRWGSDSPLMSIKGDGKVGIGTTDPAGTLHLQAPSGGDVELYFYADAGANPNDKWKFKNSYATNNLELVNNGTSRFSVSPSGVFVGGASADISDERLKENITSISDPLKKITALKGRTFTWKASANMISGTQYGLIAQELETVLPELVLNENGIRSFDKDGNLKPDESRFNKEEDEYAKSVSMTGCIPIIIEALKELSVKVEALENA
jgi:hypothetical protein